MIEGFSKDSLYGGNMHENAFRGFILALAIKFKIPLIYTIDEKDTANYMSIIAAKKKSNTASLRQSKTLFSDLEQIQFIVEGFPNIGPVAARKLISEFKTLKGIANASKERLEEAIGKKADRIYGLFNVDPSIKSF